jgi:hypothetical protein
MSEVALDISECRYGKALSCLERDLNDHFHLDLHLRAHAASLIKAVHGFAFLHIYHGRSPFRLFSLRNCSLVC